LIDQLRTFFPTFMNHILTDRVVLVLNRNWQAIATITQEQALSRLVAGTAKALWIDAQNFQALSWDEWTALPVTADDRVIGTVKGKIRAPSIILLQRYDKVPMITLSFSLRNLWERDGGRCQYSGRLLAPGEGDIDHVIPRSRGGGNTWENCVLSDKSINRKKAARTPAEAGLRLLKAPTQPRTVPSTLRLRNIHGIPEWEHFLPR
jgi:5-methylcytosine-specific restriction endonuclease McrA